MDKDGFKSNNSTIIKNYGDITVNNNAKIALMRIEVLESLAYTLYIALSSSADINNIRFLTESEIKGIINLDDEKNRQKLMEP